MEFGMGILGETQGIIPHDSETTTQNFTYVMLCFVDFRAVTILI